MIVIAVKLVVAESDAAAFEARLKQHAANSLTQEGCKGFLVARDQEHPGAFQLWDTYPGIAAFGDHTAADFMADFREFSTPLVEDRVLALCDQIA